jgi:hypothetical protein
VFSGLSFKPCPRCGMKIYNMQLCHKCQAENKDPTYVQKRDDVVRKLLEDSGLMPLLDQL